MQRQTITAITSSIGHCGVFCCFKTSHHQRIICLVTLVSSSRFFCDLGNFSCKSSLLFSTNNYTNHKTNQKLIYLLTKRGFFSSSKMSNNRKISSDLDAFQNMFNRSDKIVALTGAGISAESGIPTFRGEGGLWRQYKSEELATPEAWNKNPGLVWQFYEYRRQLVARKEPNPAHRVIKKNI